MNRGHELDTIDDHNGMQKSPYHSEIEPVTKEERDAQVLARLGKKSVLEVYATSTLSHCALSSYVVATIRIHLHPWIHLYHFNHMGRISHVSLPFVRGRRHDIDSIDSLFTTGLTK